MAEDYKAKRARLIEDMLDARLKQAESHSKVNELSSEIEYLDEEQAADILESATKAFWKVVAEMSGVSSGDISPNGAAAFDKAASNAIDEWLAANLDEVPDENYFAGRF